mgnify:CR=1 FL=1
MALVTFELGILGLGPEKPEKPSGFGDVAKELAKFNKSADGMNKAAKSCDMDAWQKARKTGVELWEKWIAIDALTFTDSGGGKYAIYDLLKSAGISWDAVDDATWAKLQTCGTGPPTPKDTPQGTSPSSSGGGGGSSSKPPPLLDTQSTSQSSWKSKVPALVVLAIGLGIGIYAFVTRNKE